MGRPLKTGLDYFPLDCKMESCVKLIQAEFGLVGFAVLIKLYQKIYSEQGYFCYWNDDEAFMFCADNGIEKELLEQIVDACIRRSIFSEVMYQCYGILTSKGIQKRYLLATTKRKGELLLQTYSLIDNSDNNRVNDGNNSITDSRKYTKESKVKESKVNIDISKDISSSQSDYDEVLKLWNSLDGLGNIKPIRAINPNSKRRTLVRARLKEYGLDGFREVVENIRKSEFLQGKAKDWTATFDWVIRPTYFVRVLEGNYNDKTKTASSFKEWADDKR